MASSTSAKHSSLLFFCFLLAILFSASSQAEARESRFFSKVTRLIGTVDKFITEVPTPAPAPAPETAESLPVPAPTPATSFDTETVNNGYGLYGTDQESTPAANEMLTEDFGGDEGSDNGYDKSNYNVKSENDNVESGKGNYYNYGRNGYGSEKSGASEQQGMSDTRFLDNGKYYPDVKNDQSENDGQYQNRYNYNGYNDQKAERGSSGYNYDQTAERGSGGYNDQTDERGSRYVFDTIEEYEKYQQSQGMYVP
ncbi:hypothetical protein TIFTF001_023005 [Ficus carica]|uniref:Protein E6-like n=1 Tax=Ficus carica TaxID=3494 RepID=A0AA88AU68_FICCA|nr:hypothetical protein TIFTF001_023005 [Ficus carica]